MKNLLEQLTITPQRKEVLLHTQYLSMSELIIVNDCSTDKSEEIFKYLLKTDKRIRIFTHLKNMGAWRSRLDAFLYSNSPYVIHFDAGDYYSDNYVLEDLYYLIKKYNLDSIRCGFRLTKKKNSLSKKDRFYLFGKNDSKIVYGRRAYNVNLFKYGIKPEWEDDNNKQGHIFNLDFFVDGTKGKNEFDEFFSLAAKNWEKIMLSLIGGTLFNAKYVNGVRFVDKCILIKKKFQFRFEIWLCSRFEFNCGIYANCFRRK